MVEKLRKILFLLFHYKKHGIISHVESLKTAGFNYSNESLAGNKKKVVSDKELIGFMHDFLWYAIRDCPFSPFSLFNLRFPDLVPVVFSIKNYEIGRVGRLRFYITCMLMRPPYFG